jgi:hypothetical protein
MMTPLGTRRRNENSNWNQKKELKEHHTAYGTCGSIPHPCARQEQGKTSSIPPKTRGQAGAVPES